MLMQDFKIWKRNPEVYRFIVERKLQTDEEQFALFFDRYRSGKSYEDLLEKLAYGLYEAQICIEGLIQDQEK